jgi:hypothetical protein
MLEEFRLEQRAALLLGVTLPELHAAREPVAGGRDAHDIEVRLEILRARDVADDDAAVPDGRLYLATALLGGHVDE